MESLFPIAKLRQLVSVALASEKYRPAESARVRAIPDVRTIRYYTTIGLIDRPAQMKGRTALYSMAHVKQLVAIKRLQGEGSSLSEIQQKLVALSSKKLDEIAELPKGLDSLIDQPDGDQSKSNSRQGIEKSSSEEAKEDAEFWRKTPRSTRGKGNQQVEHVLKIRLGGNAVLELKTDSQDVDVQRLIDAAKNLADELKRQKL